MNRKTAITGIVSAIALPAVFLLLATLYELLDRFTFSSTATGDTWDYATFNILLAAFSAPIAINYVVNRFSQPDNLATNNAFIVGAVVLVAVLPLSFGFVPGAVAIFMLLSSLAGTYASTKLLS